MSTSVSSVVSHFPSAENGFTTTTAGSVASGATTVTLNSVAGYTNGETVVLVIDPTDANKKQTFTGTVDTAGVQITNVVWTAGTNQTHALGATVVDYATATHISMMTKGILVEHNQDGTHEDVTAESLAVSGTTALTGALTIKSYDGYIYPTYTPVYVSSTSIKVTGTDVTAQFPVGTKIVLTQSGLKYFYVTSSSFSTDTTINLTGGSDYSVANAAISGFGYSYDATPQGFPQYFNYTPTWTGLTIGNATQSFAYNQIGKTVIVRFSVVFGSTTSVSGATSFTLPVTANAGYTLIHHVGVVRFQDASSTDSTGVVGLISTTNAQLIAINSGSTYLGEVDLSSTVPFTWTTSDAIKGTITYEAA